MARKYKDDDRMYLALTENARGWTFGWYCGDEGYVTCEVGDIISDRELETESAPTEKSKWESWIVAKVALEHGCDRKGIFANNKAAKIAMSAANDALLRGDRKPEPAWMAHARAAGWTAPDGWKP